MKAESGTQRPDQQVLSDSEALARCITCVLDTSTLEVIWCDFQVDWNPIITALTCKLLLSCGLRPDIPWYIERAGFSKCTLLDSFRWLNNAIHPDGAFGTDFWDAAQLGILIERYSLSEKFSAYGSLKKYLLENIRTRRFVTDISQWWGPGFTAAGIEYMRSIGDAAEAAALTRMLLPAQTPAGSWPGLSDASGSPIISPVWHTAQCIVVLKEEPTAVEAVSKAADWLRQTQDRSGAWVSVQQYNIYFTAYAIMALMTQGDESIPALRKAVEYMKGQMGPDGKCSDLGGTLMCAQALRAVVGDQFQRDLTLSDFVLSRKNATKAVALTNELEKAEATKKRLQDEIERYEKKYGDADIVFTKKQALMFTLVALLLTALGTVAGVYGLNAVLRPTGPPTAVSVPNQTPAQNINSVPEKPAVTESPSSVDSKRRSDDSKR